ncbi:DNA/RNA polymerases superfamily protein [Gossypium australe]|uniref:DNA/RNA polymerases superfamily protein n=1 Tax=Gossypium australe TaxID=47621 RepID=A0A5B6VN21_9ROSI|nr:DNA/RNA polymerases superfamily protein [Gossypium australe]
MDWLTKHGVILDYRKKKFLVRSYDDQEDVFAIEVFTGTNLVTISPYHMVPKKLKELKVQLQDLLDHGFIRLGELQYCTLKGKTIRCDFFKLKDNDISKMVFRTCYDQYEFLVKPFSLINAPKAFMDLMNRIFLPYLDQFVVVFIENILNNLKSESEHEQHIQIKLHENLSKCELWLAKVVFLGHVISTDGIRIDSKRSRLSYSEKHRKICRKFVVFLDWLCQESFEKLKQMLTEAPVLTLSKLGKDFVVYSDALLNGLGCVLITLVKHVVADSLSKKAVVELRVILFNSKLIVMRNVYCGSVENCTIDDSGCLRFPNHIFVPDVVNLKVLILREAHNIPFSMHLGRTKMYRDLQELYWWSGMKTKIVQFITKCVSCQGVKAEHQDIIQRKISSRLITVLQHKKSDVTTQGLEYRNSNTAIGVTTQQ